jgi:uncharacterized membrane protein
LGQDETTEGAANARLVHRMVFFSDAVFAIVLTLLVLELHPPPRASDLTVGLQELAPHFLAFTGSFAVISIFWAAHLTLTRRMVVFDWPTTWINLLFLFAIALMPFGSALLGVHGAEGTAWRIYCAILIGASFAQTLLWLCISRDRGRLIAGVAWRERAYRTVRALSPGIAFGAGFWAVGTSFAQFAVLCWVLIPPIMLLAALLFGARHPRTPVTAE